METEKNIISSEAKLSAIAAVMFFSPFVKNRVKSDSSFSDEERDFIAWYVQIWFVNLVFLIFVLAASITNVFVVNWILSWVKILQSVSAKISEFPLFRVQVWTWPPTAVFLRLFLYLWEWKSVRQLSSILPTADTFRYLP